MKKRGPLPSGKVKTRWSSELAYAIGLLTADGCLSKDGRHIDFTSKDKDQVETFCKCLGLSTKISSKRSGAGRTAHHTQFGDVLFYKFLLSVGLTPAKSRTLSFVKVPDIYFPHFLRGLFDGDGTTYAYFDPVFPKSYRFYISFGSASPSFIVWLQKEVSRLFGVRGSISCNQKTNYYQLRYSKREAVELASRMYRKNNPSLKRKRLKIEQSMRILCKTPEW